MARNDDLKRIEAKQDLMAGKIESLQVEHAQSKVRIDGTHQDMEAVKDALIGTNRHLQDFSNRLGEYNSQLAVHIAGVNASREQNHLLRQQVEQFIKESNARLEKLEAPYKMMAHAGKAMKWLGAIGAGASAIYGLFKFLTESLGLF